MFIQFTTDKNEKIIVGIEKIMLISEEKKGVTVVLSDGTPIRVFEDYETVTARLVKRELLPLKNTSKN